MASVEKRGKTWSVRYLAKDAYGNIIGQKRKSGFKTKGEAMAAAQNLERATAAGVDVHGDNMTCGQLVQLWLADKRATVEQTTFANYSTQSTQFLKTKLANVSVKALTHDTFKTALNEFIAKGLKLSTAKDYMKPLRMSCKWAYDRGTIPRNPLQGIRLPKTQKSEQVILTEQDITDIIAIAKEKNPRYLIPFYLAVYGGLRREEAAGLTWDKVDFATGKIRIVSVVAMAANKNVHKEPKSRNSTRTITLPKFVMDYLKLYAQPSGYVVLAKNGNPLHLASYGERLKTLVKAANKIRAAKGAQPMPCPTYHDLRHTHVALLISLGIQPKVIAERLGHSSISITMDVYGYLMPGAQEQVASALDAKWA